MADSPLDAPRMASSEHVDWLRAESASCCQAVAIGDLGASVPSCPEWMLRDLTAHLGGVRRWARTAVLRDTDPRDECWTAATAVQAAGITP